MSSFNTQSLPDNVKRCMADADRKPLGKAGMTQPEADAKFTARREKEIQENIAGLLRHRNITFFRQRMDRKTTGQIGWPDFTFAIKGHACACEVKTPDGVISPEQQEMLTRLMAEGWAVCVVRSEALFLAWINTITEEMNAA